MQLHKKWKRVRRFQSLLLIIKINLLLFFKNASCIVFLKKEANLKSGSKEPGKVSVGSIPRDKIRSIAEAKMKDLNANDIEAAMRMVEGSARSMGLEVVG